MSVSAEARLDRARREALRFAREARRLARRHRKSLGEAREKLEAGAADVESAVEEGKADRLSAALKELNQLWDAHLGPRLRSGFRTALGAAAAAAVLSLFLRTFVLDTWRVRSVSMEPTLLPGDVLLLAKSAYGIRIPFTHLRLFAAKGPRRGDVVVFDDPGAPGSVYVKRVVGVPGDVVELREQVLHVNGVPQPRTLVGEYAVAVEGEEGAKGASICRRYREALAKGAFVPEGEGEGDLWEAAAAAGIASYDVLQCRRPRAAAREGASEAVRPGNVLVLGDDRDLSTDGRSLSGWQVPFGHIRGRAWRVLWSWGEGGWSPHGEKGLRLDRLFKDLAAR